MITLVKRIKTTHWGTSKPVVLAKRIDIDFQIPVGSPIKIGMGDKELEDNIVGCEVFIDSSNHHNGILSYVLECEDFLSTERSRFLIERFSEFGFKKCSLQCL